MFQRTFLVLLLALLPLGAMADTASDNAAASQLSQPGAAAANLGPSSGGSTTDGTNLQPAGTSPLQSTTSDSNGLTAPDSSMLQEPASSSSGNLQVLLGDNADGGQQPLPSSGINYWYWLAIAVLLGLIAGGVSVYVRARNREAMLATIGSTIPELPATNYESGEIPASEESADVGSAEASSPEAIPEDPSEEKPVTPPEAPASGSVPDQTVEDKPTPAAPAVPSVRLHHASHPGKVKKSKRRHHK